MLFPEVVVVHLPFYKSDHRPLLLRLRPGSSRHPPQKPFRFLANWVSDASFPAVVRDAWTANDGWLSSVARFQELATKWNQDTFGNIFHKKRRLLARLEGIDRW